MSWLLVSAAGLVNGPGHEVGRTQTQTLIKTILAALTINHDLDKIIFKTSTCCSLFRTEHLIPDDQKDYQVYIVHLSEAGFDFFNP